MATNENRIQRTRAVFFIILTAIAGGSISTFTKITLQQIPILSFASLRFLLAGLTLLPFVLAQKAKLNKKLLPRAALISLLATINTLLFLVGVKKTTAGVAQTLYAAVPLITGVISYLLLKQKLTSKKILGIIVGFIGVVIIVLVPLLGTHHNFAGDLVGNIIILVAALSFSFYSVLSKQFQTDFTPLQLTSIFIFTTFVVQLLFIPLDLYYHSGWWQTVSLQAWLGLLYVGVVGTGIYYLTFQYAIKHATPTIATTILYLQPVLSLVWAFFLLGEHLTSGFIVGALLAFSGVTLVISREKIKNT